jgi:sugar O-acyltransferase (sialic acid O-acetyltransferase NeuD family)
MKRIIILGAGGHAKVVCDALRLSGYHVLGFLDDNPDLQGSQIMGIKVLGYTHQVGDLHADGAVVGIGENRIRQRLYEQLLALEMPLVNAIHPSAVITSDAELGQGIAVFANVVVNPGSRIGNNVILNTASTVDHDCVIADHVHIAPGVHLCGGVQVGEGALVGVAAAVIPYKRIGPHTVIGGGALVAEDIPGDVLAYGVPARTIRPRDPDEL